MLFDIWILFVDFVGTQIMRENFKFEDIFKRTLRKKKVGGGGAGLTTQ